MNRIEELKARVIGGGSLTEEEAYGLLETPNKEELYQAEGLRYMMMLKLSKEITLVSLVKQKVSQYILGHGLMREQLGGIDFQVILEILIKHSQGIGMHKGIEIYL